MRLVEREPGCGDRQVVADDELAVVAEAAGELLELEGEQAAVDAELDDVAGDLVADPAHHLEALQHAGDVADRDEVLDLERRQGAGDLVEARLVALEGLQGLVGAGQDRGGVLEHVAAAVDVEGDDAHRLAHRDDGVAGLLGDALGRAVPGAGLAGLDRRGRDELGGGPQDAGAPRGRARWRRPSWPARAGGWPRTRRRAGSRRCRCSRRCGRSRARSGRRCGRAGCVRGRRAARCPAPRRRGWRAAARRPREDPLVTTRWYAAGPVVPRV